MDMRRQILSKEDLLAAPRACQQAFWLRRNRQRRRQNAARLGDVATEIVSEESLAGDSQVVLIAQAWRELMAKEYLGLTAVESYRNGRLMVTVDSAATKYSLSRRLGGEFMQTLNRTAEDSGLTQARVRRIAFRIGAVPAGQETPRSGGGESRDGQ